MHCVSSHQRSTFLFFLGKFHRTSKMSKNIFKPTTALARARGFREVLARFSRLSYFWNVLGPVRTCSDAFGHVQMRSGSFRIFSFCSTLFALVPNTGEANGEMCGPTTPEISEMYSLKPFNCLFVDCCCSGRKNQNRLRR